ncbi:probable galacturonosyltransferase 3 isoform X2 [Magnolia sinica]|nr:probable galacturonosyltransferase 3 isoform X2 [Magnolia sinica]
MLFISVVGADTSEAGSHIKSDTPALQSNSGGYRHLSGCEKCGDGKDIDIIVTYTDVSGDIRIANIKSKDLSPSWVWEDPNNKNHDWINDSQGREKPFHVTDGSEESNRTFTDEHSEGAVQYKRDTQVSPVKIQRRKMRQKRREERTAELIRQNPQTENQMQEAAIERAKQFNNTVRGKYSIWRREYSNRHSDSILKLMRDQIIMAKAYGSIARSKNENYLYNSLKKHIRESQRAIGEANSDVELQPGAFERVKEMGNALSMAKDKLYDCALVARKLRAMLQTTEESITALKKQSAFLIQLAAKTLPKSIHCLSLQLTTDYLLQDRGSREVLDADKIEDPALHHYAIFSDNVLATSVVVNSTTQHAQEPEKHVFHIVTDRLNVAAMKMWFLVNAPADVTIEVKNIDDFKWLNSSYCSVLRQLESARIKEYYFKANHPSTLSAGDENLKYRNPKYLSMLNHLRFYLPEVYPKLDKILFLDDDIVVQKDLTPLWSIDLQGMVNGAVETCKESFHRFDKYLNFSNPLISQNFDPNACGWAFGMNMFDLKEWKKRNMTGVYHRWQDMNEERTLWKLGSLPPGLITFYNLTYPLERSWHVLGLGYDPALNQTEIENAAVIHYNGNYKPWLDLAITKYKVYWSKFVMSDNPYLQHCNINEWTLQP